jgi:hydrogenase 3 maturation protease
MQETRDHRKVLIMPDTSALVSEVRAKITGKIALVGIGNIMRGDDGLGSKLIEMLKCENLHARLFDCGTAPENYAIPILATSADTIIFVDAADMGLSAGEIRVVDLEDISKVSFSTHSPSPRLFIDLLKTGKDDLNIFFISIQPKSTSLGAHLSAEVTASLELLKDALVKALT